MRLELVLDLSDDEEDSGHWVATFEHDEREDVDARTVVLEVDESLGKPVVRAVTIKKQAGVASRDIRVPLDRYLDVLARHGVVRSGDQRRRRREWTDDFLREVVDAYRAAGGSVAGITPDVNPEFNVSKSTKFRWLKAARDRGILTDEGADDGER